MQESTLRRSTAQAQRPLLLLPFPILCSGSRMQASVLALAGLHALRPSRSLARSLFVCVATQRRK